jgi:hypothetical protein
MCTQSAVTGEESDMVKTWRYSKEPGTVICNFECMVNNACPVEGDSKCKTEWLRLEAEKKAKKKAENVPYIIEID